jgi:transglutaminase-like putative cysteine protease
MSAREGSQQERAPSEERPMIGPGPAVSWRIAVLHHTGYHYAAPVRASYNEARMTPVTGDGQQTLESRLEVAPAARPLRYVDYWGTVVHAFDIHVPHTELAVTSTSVVETAGSHPEPPALGWEALADRRVRDRFAELTVESRYVVLEPEVVEMGRAIAAEHDPVAAGRQAGRWVHEQLSYERGATGVHSTSAEARAVGCGVCQDYAHLSLALLRAMGLPARYVSGYLHTSRDGIIGETTRGESHAWVEYWAGSWLPVDPTSLADVAERHVVVARGRDYADVRPLAGVYRGPSAEALGVIVELTRLR